MDNFTEDKDILGPIVEKISIDEAGHISGITEKKFQLPSGY